MTRSLIAALAAACIASPAVAADLGKPRALPIDEGKPAIWTGCHVGAHVAGNFLRDGATTDAITSVGISGGCDLQQSRVVFGASAAYDVGRSDFRAATITGRAGVTVNPHVLVYGLATLTMDGRSPNPADSILSAGAGIETWIGTNLTIYGEVAKDLKAIGDMKALDEAWAVRAGIRYRF